MKRNHNLIERAVALAVRAHEGKMRKGTLMPYIVHPVAVAFILARHGFSDTVIAAALVHDTVEDTSVTDAELRHELGDEVADLVAPANLPQARDPRANAQFALVPKFIPL